MVNISLPLRTMHSTLSPRPKPLSLNQKPLCATVGLAIESDNVVGYTIGTTGSDNNFVTVPFALVGFNTSDIQQIKPKFVSWALF